MKKILSFLLFSFLLSGCSSENTTTLVCKLNTDSEYYTTQVTYVYNDDDEILSLTSYSEYHLTDEDLLEYSLEDIYAVYEDAYADYQNIKGITIEVLMDSSTNMISESIKVDISEYDFTSDEYRMGTAEDYSSMADIFTIIEATDAVVCE